MNLKALTIDFGGVLVRTTDPAPRARLAESLGLSSRQLEQLVFEGPSAERATVGEITQDQHWRNLTQALKLPDNEGQRIHDEFFGGDTWDGELFDLLRELRKTFKTALISNAWTGLRRVLVEQHVEDAFDTLVISAEVKLAKPDARIYRLALERLGVAPAEGVFIDDMNDNVEAARALGMHAFPFTRSRDVREEIRRLFDHRQ